MKIARARVVGLTVLLLCGSVLGGAQSPKPPKFFSDDPLSCEPETQDASGAKFRDVELAPIRC